MKQGGSKRKGSAFEREVGRMLSLWLTRGARADIFARSVLSGGQFTNALKTGGEINVAGDLMAAHPLAFDFIKAFSVECKFYADLNIEALIYGKINQSFLGQVYLRTEKDGAHIDTLPFVVAKQNRRPPLVMMPTKVIHGRVEHVKHKVGFINYHVLHNGYIALTEFEPFLSCVDPVRFLRYVEFDKTGVAQCPAPSQDLPAPSKPIRSRRRLLEG